MLKILIVDDEPINQKLLEYMLLPYGTITLAENGIQAVATFDNALRTGEPFKLIFMDIMMPVMDGMLAMKKIRVLEKKHGITLARAASIVMATSMDMPTTQIDSHGVFGVYGCNDFLIKPVTKKKLLPILKTLNLIAD